MAQTKPATVANRNVLLAVTGSIAAYKAPFVLRQLRRSGANVRVVLSPGAKKFIGAQTFLGLGAEVFESMWDRPGELHVELAQWADVIVVAPMTADTMARFASGRCDDLLTATLLCATCPICVAPAMHPSMWAAPVSQLNARRLFKRGVRFIGPVLGEVASGDIGLGRLAEPDSIAQGVTRALAAPGPLGGRHIVVTAGPTVEPIDPVRSLTNASSGKMGYALAEVAIGLGADVTLISGPVGLAPPALAQVVPVHTARDMHEALLGCLGPDLSEADAVIMAAAVADFRPEQVSAGKVKRTAAGMTLSLTANPDILSDLGYRRQTLRPVLIGFALETASGDELIQLARQKLISKRVDLIVANRASESLNRDDAQVMLVSPIDCTVLRSMKKPQVAAHILAWLAERLAGPEAVEQTR